MTEKFDSTSLRDRAAPNTASEDAETTTTRRLPSLGLNKYSGLYVIAALILVFGIWLPETFLTTQTLKSVADQQSITALVALALIIPMAAGVFDLSVAAQVALSVVAVSWFQSHGYHPAVSVVAALLIGSAVGAINGFVVVRLNVNSFIATLGMSSLLAGLAFWVTGGQPIVSGFSPAFISAGRSQPFGIPLPVIYLVVIAGMLWYVLEFTPVGRYLYAAGGNSQAARLAGVRVDRVVFGSLVASGFVACLAGVILTAKLGVGSHEVGPPYLLPVFAAAFLGATQIKNGRVNVIGTIVAVYLLATGVKGLQLAGAPAYVNDIFNGGALIIAVALASRRKRSSNGPR
jgi:ribose transport system permease protein